MLLSLIGDDLVSDWLWRRRHPARQRGHCSARHRRRGSASL